MIYKTSKNSSMKGSLKIYYLFSIFFCAFYSSSALAGWEVDWIDKFNGNRVDWNNWTAQIQANYNNEAQCYTDDDMSSLKNYDVSNGTLKIIARKGDINCPGLNGTAKTWTSGRLNSKDKKEFNYGRIEARVRVYNSEHGSWPAFWMLENRINEAPIKGDNDNVSWPNPGAGEIDIWEWTSNQPNNMYMNTFAPWGGPCKKDGYHRLNSGFLDVQAWHKYALERDQNSLKFYIDDALVTSHDVSACDQFQDDMFVILNLAMGGDLGGSIDPALTTATIEVDYVSHCLASGGNNFTSCDESTPVIGAPPQSSSSKSASSIVSSSSSKSSSSIMPSSLPASSASAQITTIQAEAYSAMAGLQTQNTSDIGGGQNVGWIDSNDWMRYGVNIAVSGWYKVEYRVASTTTTGVLILSQNGQELGGNVQLPNTGDWQNWVTVSSRVYLSAGIQDLSLVAKTGGFNLNWFSLSAEVVVDPCASSAISLPGKLEAEAYCAMQGVQTENTSDANGGLNVGWIDGNDWMRYSVNVAAAGWYKIDYRVASNTNNALLSLTQNAQDLGSNISIPNTGGWQNWVTVSSRVYLSAGVQSISLVAKTGGFNLNWVNVTPEAVILGPCASASTINIPSKIEAEAYCNMQGLQTETTNDSGGGLNIGWTDSGDWLDYKINVATAGSYALNYRIASNQAGGQLAFGSLTPNVFSNTGGWQNWQTFSTQVMLAAGVQVIRLNVTTAGFNINWFELQPNFAASSSRVLSSIASSVVASSRLSSSVSSLVILPSSVARSSSIQSSQIMSSTASSLGGATPNFGANVKVFDVTMGDVAIQAEINSIFSVQQLNHALDAGQQENPVRTAILFKPGSYHVDIPVGFYTQVLGLGASPDDVQINGKVTSEPYISILHPEWGNNATQNFWRGIENFSTRGDLVTWAVSQSTFFRRMHINGDVHLYEVDNSRPSWNVKSWGSGGWISDSLISGSVDSGLQQQWFTRNSNWLTSWMGDDNNFMVFLGIPSTNIRPANIATILPVTPIIAEKPLLLYSGNRYEVFVPALKTNSSGISWANGKGAGTTLPISAFYIAHESDTAAMINTALDQGKHLLLTPGIYNLLDTIRITQPNTIVLGLGFATLHPVTGKTALSIADVDGVRVANIVVSAGSIASAQLIEVGSAGSNLSHSANPSVLSDVFVSIGGAMEGQADKAMVINSNDVITDHMWLWRADHGNGVGWDLNRAKNGLVVNGNNVTAYGLFVEHFEEYQTIWNGNNGRTYFYQSEIPYDPPYQEAWSSASGVKGWASYKVGNNVTSHEAWGLGIYTAFNTYGITMTRGIEAPASANVKFHNMVNAKFNNITGGTIDNIINDKKDPAGVIMGDYGNGKPRLGNYPL